ncbi:MAG: hypothetical protein ABIE94_07050 [archaeon]
MNRGRPIGSSIRQNMVEVLYFLGKAHGYNIYKHYIQIFPRITLRVVYYHLKKGVQLGEFKLEKVEVEKGDYSWGSHAEKRYYVLGPKAKAKINSKVKSYFDKLKSKSK